jgi:anti-anti-sigma factor
MTISATRAHLPEGQIFLRQQQGRTIVLVPAGHLEGHHEPEIVHETSELLKYVLTSSEPTNIVVDLGQSRFLGTAMLGAIVKLWKRVSERGGKLVLCEVANTIEDVLRCTKLHTVWPIYASRHDALLAVGA